MDNIKHNKYAGISDNLIYHLLASSAYIKANRLFIFKMGIQSTIVLAEIIQIYKLFERKDLLKDGYFYAQYDFMAKETGLTIAMVRSAVKDLEERGLIKTEIFIKDLKKRKYYKPDFYMIDDMLKVGDRALSEFTEDEDSYIIYNKYLGRIINPICAIIIGDLITSYNYAKSTGHLDSDGYFFYKQNKLCQRLNISRQTMWRNHIKRLKDDNIIDIKQGGYPKQDMIKLNYDKICEILDIKPTWELKQMLSGTRDGVKSSTYTDKDKEEFLRRAMELEAAGDMGIF